MRVIQTVNDTIRLLFNPKTEVFSLSDFLLVRDVDENFLAQVVEVYDDKFDQEANVAKIKLIYRIVNGNEIKPYDNYTPSRECEVAKIKQSEIEKCINLDKKTIAVGKSYKTKEQMQLNTNFFDNNCVIFADKFEQTNQIFETLSPRLSKYKNILILDFSGAVKIEGACHFAALKNFKLPLAYDTIDYIQQKSLMRAKLETQVVLGDVFEEVKKFLVNDEEYYIPYQRFIKVVQNQAKQTPSVELQVLISWLKKYDRLNIFAKNKKEYEGLFKSVEKNKITVLDLSNLKIEWQKEFVEYISNKIEKDIFLLARLNDNNINNDILNNLYFKKNNISFIPSFSYGYKKASYIMEFAQNYILLPAMNPKRDFTHANFQIQSLNKDAFMLFGDDTKDFIFTLQLETPFKPKDENEDKDKLFISLNLQLEDMTPFELRPNNFEIKQKEPRQKRLHEEIMLSDVLEPRKDNEFKEETELETESIDTQYVPLVEIEKNQENISEVVEQKDIQKEIEPQAIITQDELDYFIEEENEVRKEEAVEIEKDVEDKKEELEIKQEENSEAKEKKEIETIKVKEETKEETKEVVFEQENEQEPLKTKEEPKVEEGKKATVQDVPKMPKIKAADSLGEEKIKELSEIKETKSELKEFAKIQDNVYPKEEDIIDDNILDAIDEVNALNEQEPSFSDSFDETLQETNKKDNKEIVIEKTKDEVLTIIDEVVNSNIEDKIKDDKTTKILDEMNAAKEKEIKEKEIEEDDIEAEFEKIINDKTNESNSSQKLKINENVSIDLEKIKKEIKTPEHKLPVFDDIKKEDDVQSASGFKEGDKVAHEKYGEGEILKVINYGQRCLLQIEFPEIGKRLLDPKIAKLKLAEEI